MTSRIAKELRLSDTQLRYVLLQLKKPKSSLGGYEARRMAERVNQLYKQ